MIGLEALEENPDSNVRFVQVSRGMRDSRKADIQVGPSRPSNGPPFEAWGCHTLRGKSMSACFMASKNGENHERMG